MAFNSFLVEQFRLGGVLMWPLLACSLVGLTLVLERVWVLYRASSDQRARREMQALMQRLGEQSREEFLAFLLRRRGVLAAVYASVLRKHVALQEERYPVAERGEALVREADLACREYLGQFFPALGTIGSIAPLLGLLGTITGMIKAFSAIAAAGVGDPGKVAAGISEALITTAAGLFIAIPVIVLHRYLAVKAGTVMRRLELYTHALGHALTEGPPR